MKNQFTCHRDGCNMSQLLIQFTCHRVPQCVLRKTTHESTGETWLDSGDWLTLWSYVTSTCTVEPSLGATNVLSRHWSSWTVSSLLLIGRKSTPSASFRLFHRTTPTIAPYCFSPKQLFARSPDFTLRFSGQNLLASKMQCSGDGAAQMISRMHSSALTVFLETSRKSYRAGLPKRSALSRCSCLSVSRSRDTHSYWNKVGHT